MDKKIIAVSRLEYKIHFNKILCFEPLKVASELEQRSEEKTNLQCSSEIGLSINCILLTKIITENIWFTLLLVNNIYQTIRNACYFKIPETSKTKLLDIYSRTSLD